MNRRDLHRILRVVTSSGAFIFSSIHFYSFLIFYNEKMEIIYKNVHEKKSISQIMKDRSYT